MNNLSEKQEDRPFQIPEEPKPEAPDWLFDNIAEASKNARKIFSIYIGVLVYGAVTIRAVTDRQIALNEPAKLPFVGVSTPLTGFVVLFPIIALILFLVLQVYLFPLKGLVKDLRANFATVHSRRLYPWFITIAEDSEPKKVGWFQRVVVGIAFWWSLPLVLMFHVVMIIRMHDTVLSYGLAGFVLFVNFVVALFWLKYTFGSSYKTRKPLRIPGRIIYGVIFFIGPLFLMSYIIPKAQSGWLHLEKQNRVLLQYVESPKLLFTFDRVEKTSWQYKYLRPHFVLDLSHQKLVTEPTIDYEGLYWADFRRAHLEGADLTGAVLKRADLREANLRGAVLFRANLDSADLRSSDLSQADLSVSFLRGALLGNADIRYAYLSNANLMRAYLNDADLRYSILVETNLKYSSLWHVNMDSAELILAHLDSAFLFNASLRGADLRDLKLSGTNLEYSDLRSAKGITVAQLSRVASLFKVSLDSVLFDSLFHDSTCLHLFVKSPPKAHVLVPPQLPIQFPRD